MRPVVDNKFLGLFGKEWYTALEKILNSKYWFNLGQKVAKERGFHTVYPEKHSDLLFKAFRTTPLSQVKVVILGQDPYHDGSYDGYAFSNKGKDTLSPSLKNIFKEIEDDIYDGFKMYQDPDLERWAKQGVLLINTAHTVRKGAPGSHLKDWEEFTDEVVNILLQKKEPVVWMLWGKKALDVFNQARIMNGGKGDHLVLTSPHPSPFSAHTGFFGNKHFSQANKYLEDNGSQSISW
jgi:uracil-DNA glycosylase